MEESAPAKPKRILPFHNSPFPVLEQIFYDANHFCCSKFIHEHFVNGIFPYYRLIGDLMVHGIFRIQVRKSGCISGIETVNPFS